MMDINSIIFTPEMVRLLTEIDEFKGAWNLLGRLSPDKLQELKKVATIESVGSSTRIEGSTLNDAQVEILLSHLDMKSFVSRDEQEVAGYGFVSQEIFDNFEAMVFSENTIKHLHLWLLKYSDKDERHRGEYKKVANQVQAVDSLGNNMGVIFETTPPFETPQKMRELVDWTKESLSSKQLHPLIVIGIFVVVFLAIHPFQDGNGRLSRILTLLLLLQSGYRYVPFTSLEKVIEESKNSYYLALRKTQASLFANRSDWTPWLLFFLRSLQKQKYALEKKINREKILRQMPELSSEILHCAQELSKISIQDVEKLTKAPRSTLKKHLLSLVKSKQLLRHGQGKGTWYTLP